MNTRGWTRIAGLTVLTVTLITAPALAQQGRGWQGGRNYDPATVTTVEATVQEVLLESGRNGGSGVHLLLQTEGEPTVVHLAPQFWLNDNDLTLAAGDRVTVTGSKTVVAGAPALIAREIGRGDTSLTLRDEAGVPAWRGNGFRTAGAGRGNGFRAAGAGRGNGLRVAGVGRGRQGTRGAGNGRGYRGGRGGGNGPGVGARAGDGTGPHCPGCIGR
ncbi:MAG: hypothetical protein PVJ49_13200 [Acidobacteriota bacterium]|jgi:hypothetical protein